MAWRSTWNASSDWALFEYEEAASKRFDERIGGLPRERRRDCVGRIGGGRPTKQKQHASWLRERLERHERPRFHPHGSDCHKIVGFVQIGARKKLLKSCGGDVGSGQLQDTNRLSQEHRFSRLGLNHHHLQPWHRECERYRRGAASTADIKHSRGSRWHVLGGNKWLDEETIDRLWRKL